MRDSGTRRDNAELSSFTLILTAECNFACRYCYQVRGRLSLDAATVCRAIDVFYPYFTKSCAVLFYGGEPLLRPDLIREAVAAVRAKERPHEKAIEYSISTNGSLLDDGLLDFFEEYRFTVLLSYDGRAQDKGRKKGSAGLVSNALDRLLARPRIDLLTNSVFSPETVADLSASIQDIVERGVRDVQVSFTNHRPWGPSALGRLETELAKLRRFLAAFAAKTGAMPVANFRTAPEPAVFGCLAGRERMALSPDGRLWGCHLFYDLHRKTKDPYTARYCFGKLDSFLAKPEKAWRRVLGRYDDLRMDYFHTPSEFCGLCPDVEDCAICPVDAAFSSDIVGRIPSDDCRIRKMLRAERRRLAKSLEELGLPPGERPRPGASKRRPAA